MIEQRGHTALGDDVPISRVGKLSGHYSSGPCDKNTGKETGPIETACSCSQESIGEREPESASGSAGQRLERHIVAMAWRAIPGRGVRQRADISAHHMVKVKVKVGAFSQTRPSGRHDRG